MGVSRDTHDEVRFAVAAPSGGQEMEGAAYFIRSGGGKCPGRGRW